MLRSLAPLTVVLFLAAELSQPSYSPAADSVGAAAAAQARDLFDAMQKGDVDAKFVAKNSHVGRIILKNNTKGDVNVGIPDAFIGVPAAMAQFGGGGGGGLGGGGGGLGGGGGQQSVGGGGGGGNRGGRGGGGRGGGGFGGGGGGRRGGGGFNIPPEKTVRIDVPLLCLDHGKKEPSSGNAYVIRPIENFIDKPAVIDVVTSYANGDLPPGAAQAAVWNLNNGVSWDELAAKQTGTKRNIVREPYFSRDEIKAGMAIAQHAEQTTAGQKIEPRPFKLSAEKAATESEQDSKEDEVVSPGEELNKKVETPEEDQPQDEKTKKDDKDQKGEKSTETTPEAKPA
jgi:hypothetical protein